MRRAIVDTLTAKLSAQATNTENPKNFILTASVSLPFQFIKPVLVFIAEKKWPFSYFGSRDPAELDSHSATATLTP